MGTKMVWKDKKIQELPPFGKFVIEVVIFRSSHSQMFFKIGALKNFPIFTGKQLCWLLQAFLHRTPRMTVLDISSSKYFFQLNLVFIADGRTGFCSELHWKHELNLRSSHGNSSIKGSSYKFSAFHRKTPVLKSLFNRVAGL